MRRTFSVALRLTLVTMALCGIVYPAIVTTVSAVVFPRQAGGSLVSVGGRIVGSELIGQSFSGPGYFHGRPSAAGAGYDAMASGASNLGPTSRELVDGVTERADVVRSENGLASDTRLPADLVTASGSGLDPHISPAAAKLQIARVARARGMSESEVARLVDAYTSGPDLGTFGGRRVNVLLLNLALDLSEQ